MLDRRIEPELLPLLAADGVGCVAYSPLAQGLLTDKDLGGAVPANSQMSRSEFLPPSQLTGGPLAVLRRLAALAPGAEGRASLGWRCNGCCVTVA